MAERTPYAEMTDALIEGLVHVRVAKIHQADDAENRAIHSEHIQGALAALENATAIARSLIEVETAEG